jgi:ribosomal protein L11 methyltransferase
MIRLAVRVAREHAELALADLLTLAPSGVEEVDCGDGTIEYAVYGAPGELPALPELRAAVGSALVDVRTSDVDEGWEERWREFHRPLEVGGRIWVRPPWAPAASGGLLDLAIEPAQAFGTGAHATTRLCLEELIRLEREGKARGSLLDVGCGSGVLAIAAVKLGWAPVLGVDSDSASVAATLANAAANGVALEARRLDLRRERAPAAETVVANLVRPLLLELASAIVEAPRWLIAGGLLDEAADEVAAAFAERHGLREVERRRDEGWDALLLAR